jgi:hypothetical protein
MIFLKENSSRRVGYWRELLFDKTVFFEIIDGLRNVLNIVSRYINSLLNETLRFILYIMQRLFIDFLLV